MTKFTFTADDIKEFNRLYIAEWRRLEASEPIKKPTSCLTNWLERQNPETINRLKQSAQVRKFSNRDKQIHEMRMAGHKLRDIGDVFNLSQERIRQIAFKQQLFSYLNSNN